MPGAKVEVKIDAYVILKREISSILGQLFVYPRGNFQNFHTFFTFQAFPQQLQVIYYLLKLSIQLSDGFLDLKLNYLFWSFWY